MTQNTKAVLLALVLVSGVSFAEGRIDSISKSQKRAAGAFVVPNLEKGVAEVFEIPEVTPEMEAAKAGNLSEAEIERIVEKAKEKYATPENKVGQIQLAQGGRVLNSTPACGWWGWRRGWGGCGWGGGWGGGCGWGGVCGTIVNVGVVYGFGFGGGCGWGGCGGGCGFFW